jgi:parallel beta-helix repeat protein
MRSKYQLLRSQPRPRGQTRAPFYRPRLESLEGRWLPSTFLVTRTDDAGAGSLRQAILDANATPGTNEIDFAIGDGGAQTIRPRTALPAVTNPVVLDGTTQPGFAGAPLIELDGADVTPGASGLEVRTDGSTIKGLAITDFLINDPDMIDAVTPGLLIAGSGNVVQGDDLGTHPVGTSGAGNGRGLWILSGSNNLIGGTAPGAGNVISGNGYGVFISYPSSGTVVQGNSVTGNGAGLWDSGLYSLVGGTAAARNLVSRNGAGIQLDGVSGRVEGNFIGTDPTGTRALPNGIGVEVIQGTNLIGGTEPGAGNLISGNGTGVMLEWGSLVQGNYIGTDVTGTRALGNVYGVSTEGTARDTTLIGGTEAGAGNLISGNGLYGIITYLGLHIVIQGNTIGTDVTGTHALGNGRHGVFLQTTARSLIGGTAAGAGNLISGNGGDGIRIAGSGSADILVQGNDIGTDVTGTQPLGNAGDGVHVDNMHNGINAIGGEEPGAGNTIAFNGNDGVLANGNTHIAILGNAIFANANLGIELLSGANNNQAAPVLTSATTDGTTTTVEGTLTSTPNTTFTLEIFASSVNNSSGAGERFLGPVVVTTDGDGNASFTGTFDTAVDPGQFLTATATDPGDNTSPFSAGAEVTGTGPGAAGGAAAPSQASGRTLVEEQAAAAAGDALFAGERPDPVGDAVGGQTSAAAGAVSAPHRGDRADAADAAGPADPPAAGSDFLQKVVAHVW